MEAKCGHEQVHSRTHVISKCVYLIWELPCTAASEAQSCGWTASDVEMTQTFTCWQWRWEREVFHVFDIAAAYFL